MFTFDYKYLAIVHKALCMPEVKSNLDNQETSIVESESCI